MRLRVVFVVVLAAATFSRSYAQSPQLAVADFVIHSDNPRYRYIGKGIAEMIAVELRKSPGIELIERERRVQILEEMEFAVSDLADGGNQLEVGRLLAAQYMVFGEIVDMDREVLVSLRMIDVQSGKVVWNDKLTEKLAKYDYISGYFAQSILSHLELVISRTTAVKTVQPKERTEELVVALSTAIDHYDKGEREQAERQLSVAKRLDPRSEATAYYLAKVLVNTAKFKVLLEPFFSYQNPAFLGIVRTDSIHFSGTVPPAYTFANINEMQIDGLNMTSFAQDKYIAEATGSSFLGYAFPIGSKLGVRIDVGYGGLSDRRWEGEYDSKTTNARNSIGVIIDLGYAVADKWAIGAGFGLFSRSKVDEGPVAAFSAPDKAVISGNLGILYRNESESLIFDTRLGINNDTYDVIDVATLAVEQEAMTPMLWENTLSLSFNERNTFLILKQINNVCWDRVYYYGTVLPAIEHFLTKWVSLRGGIEGSLSVLNDSFLFGYGVLGGFTFRNIRRGFEVDLNVTYRLRPSRAVEELLYPDLVVLLNLAWNDLFVSRK